MRITPRLKGRQRPCVRLCLEELEPRTVPSATVYRSADVPHPIPDLGRATSTLTVPDSATIGDVSVTLNLAHSRGGDLDVALVAPDGTRVELLTAVAFGQDNRAAPFRALTLEDRAARSVRDVGGSSAQSFRPEGVLGELRGRAAQGLWTLEVSDEAAGQTGTIVDWSLTIANVVPEVEPNDTSATAQTIDPTAEVDGLLTTQTDTDFYRLNLSVDGVLNVRVNVSGAVEFDPRLILRRPDGTEIVRSEGLAAQQTITALEQTLGRGSYVLEVSAQPGAEWSAAAGYGLGTQFTPFPLARQPNRVGNFPAAVVLEDVNDDDQADLVTANRDSADVSVLLGNGDGSFQPQRRFAVGEVPTAVAVGDINGDGQIDLVAANRYSNDVSVLLGIGDGSFQTQRRFEVGDGPTAVALGDVNGDGRVDLVTANGGSADVSVLLGNGDGSFQEQGRFIVGFAPSAVALGDVDGDDRPDLVTANSGSAEVSVLLGSGDGTFQPTRQFAVGDVPSAVVLGDVDGDDRLDVVTANRFSADVSVLLGYGDGSFQEQRRFAVAFSPYALALGDVNGDGRADLVTANRFSADVSVLLGNGDGSFQEQRRVTVGDGPTAVALGDVNGDHRPDLVTANRFSADVSVLLGNGDGSFQPQRRFAVGDVPSGVTLGDVNGDGRSDLVVANRDSADVSVLLGSGDGSFQTQRRFAVGEGPLVVALGDVNGDGRPDLVTANRGSADVSVLQGNGDGSFQPQGRFFVGSYPTAVAVGDVNGDDRPDLVVTNRFNDDVSVLLGNGAGSFQEQRRFDVGVGPAAVVVGDVNGDGRPDLVTANRFSDDVSVLLGNGDGFFQPQRRFDVGVGPTAVVLGDVNGDGRPDLVTANNNSDDASVLLGNGDGSFQPPILFAVGDGPVAVALGDVNGDERPDLVIVCFFSADASVLLGNGDGSFQPQQRFAVGDGPAAVAVGDVNGDERPDLVTANGDSADASVLLGNGDGSFQPQRRLAVGDYPTAVAVGDINGDGRADVVSANFFTADVSVLLGNGDGSFQPQRRFAVGDFPTAVAVGDVNGDGRPDVVTANRDSNDVSVLLGNGDGSFQTQRRFRVGSVPAAVALGDVNGDGRPDLVTANTGNAFDPGNDVSVLLGNGDGSFQSQRRFKVGDEPAAVAVGDVNDDGRLDLVTANRSSNDVSVRLGNGDGSFQPQRRFATGTSPAAVALGDINGDERPDLVTTANNFSGDVIVLLGNGDGSFQPQFLHAVGDRPAAVVLGDVNGDERPDLVTANSFSDDVSVLLGNGDGSFQEQRRFAVGDGPSAVALGDVNGDGRPDLVTANGTSDDASVLLGIGDGTFVLASPESTIALRHTPQRADLDGDGNADIVQLNDAGQLLFRRGLPGGTNLYAPPLVVNPTRPARDLVLVQSPFGPRVAVSEVQTNSVALYASSLTFEFQGLGVVAEIVTERLPQRMVVGDLDGDGRDDLVIGNTLSGTVTVALQQPDGSFDEPRSLDVGITPSEIALAELDDEAGLDVIVTDQFSGQVVVRYNDTQRAFARLARFRAGTGLSDAQLLNGSPQVHTLEQPVSVVAADFNHDGAVDAVVVNRGASSFNTLLGTPGGGFTNPSEALRFSTSDGRRVNDQAGQVIAHDFDRDDHLDLAILMENRGEIWLYQGHGDGTFTLLSTVPAGNVPTGFSLAQLNDDDHIDLLVGNGFGDVLTILGNGDGSFRPFVRTDNRVPFVALRKANGTIEIVLADQARDRATSRRRDDDAFSPGAFQRDGRDGLIGPGDVTLADLDGRFGKDLIFANTGSNNVLVYLRQRDGTFADEPLSFFAGTNPTGLHVAQLNDDNGDTLINNRDFPDLAIANQGSNDVSVLLGSRNRDSNRDGVTDDRDLFRLGPRLTSGEAGPTVVTSGLINGDRIPDLISASRADSTATLLPGVGNGLFDDEDATTISLPGTPVGINDRFVLLGSGDIVALGFGAGVATIIASTGRDSVAFDTVDVGLDLPLFFVANTDGSVTALVPDDGGFLAVNQTVDGLDSPSALRILRDSSGFDAYISDARDGGLMVIRFGIDQLQLNLEPASDGSSLALAATLTTSLAGTNSLLVPTPPLLTDVLLDPSVVLGVEEVLTEPTFANGAVVGPGERLLAKLEEQFDALDNNPPAPVVIPPTTLQQYLFGLDEAMRQLGWKQSPVRSAPLPRAEPAWDWLQLGKDAIDWLMSLMPPRDNPAPDESQEEEAESRFSLGDRTPFPLPLAALVGGLLLTPCVAPRPTRSVHNRGPHLRELT